MAPGPIDDIITNFQTIIRTRRRALALISGIILATMILSGIILYSSVLTQRNFESIVGNTSYEISFNKFNNESIASLNDLGEQIISDPRIDAYAAIGGIQSNSQNSILDISVQSVIGGPYVQYNSQNGANFEPLFVDNTFFETEIGQSIQSVFFEGEFRLPLEDEVIIPRFLASETGLTIGDTINQINYTMTIFQDEGNVVGDNAANNFTIIGIYDQESAIATDFVIDQIPVLDYANLIFNENILNNQITTINNIMRQSANFQLLISIDETQFTVSEPEEFVAEIDKLMNQISKNYGEPGDLVGRNMIGSVLLGFTIFSIIVSIMYTIISIPVILLSLYVLNYGLSVSLEERKREIAIKKVQGGSASQIFNEIRNETLLIYVLGIIFGYFLATFVAFVIGNAVGFFELEVGTLADYVDYIEFNLTAILVSAITIGLILLIVIYRQGQKFINEEVTSSIKSKPEVVYGFLRSTNLDIVFFIIGFIGFLISFAEQILLWDVPGGTFVVLVQIFTPFLIWFGGAVVGSRIVKIIPQFLEPVYLRLFVFKDVSRLIKAGLRRRGDVNRLAIVIILALAVASMSVIQGVTDEYQVAQNIEYRVGSDFKVNTADFVDLSPTMGDIPGVEAVQPVSLGQARIFSSNIIMAGIDPSLELHYLDNNDPLIHWERDSFVGSTASDAMETLKESPRGIFISPGLANSIEAEVGDTVTISITLANPTINQSQVGISEIEILGLINLLPGGLGTSVLTTHDFMAELVYEALEVPEEFRSVDYPLLANQYQVKMTDSDLDPQEISDHKQAFLALSGVTTVSSLQEELNNLEQEGTGFGITGLLTLAASVGLLATFVSSFAFSSIIMERRKREFAVLRAVGAKKSQIYKLAMGENFLMMLIGVIWGTFIGVAVAVIFNGFFGFVSGELLRQLTVNREIIFPWVDLTIFGAITLGGMMLATMLSIRQSVNADLTTATRAE